MFRAWMVGLRRPVQRSEAGRSTWVSFFEELETMEHLWKDYGKIYGKDGKIYGRDGKSTEHMENLWKTGDRHHGTPPNRIVYDHNNCHFTVIPCYTVVPHSQMQPYSNFFLQSKYWGDITMNTMILWVMFPRT